MELTYWKLRLDLNDEVNQKHPELEKKFERWLRVYETGKQGENAHFHYYVEMYAKEKNIRHYIRTKLNLKGNGGYSLVSVTPQPVEYVSYMLKAQKKHDCTYSDLDDGVLVTLHDQARIHSTKVKEEIKQKKLGKKPQWLVIQEYILEKIPEFSYGKEQTIHEVVNYYIEKRLMMREFQVVSTVQTILLHNNFNFRFEFQRKILDRIL